MSVPYYVITASSSANPNSFPRTRGQLFRDGANPDGSLHSSLVGYRINPLDANKLLIEATYKVDRIPGAPKACLIISQTYEFYRDGLGPCEPSESLPCSRFRPMVSYSFHGGQGEFLASLNIPQRHHYLVRGRTGNTVGVFRDADCQDFGSCTNLILNWGFVAVRNPVAKEFWSPVIGARGGTFASSQAPDVPFDNFHQTNSPNVQQPSLRRRFGCPECVHDHWRWSSLFGPPVWGDQWGGGRPLIPNGSTQTVDMGVVRYPGKVSSQQPEWLSLVNGEDLYTTVPQDPVFWFSPTGYMREDHLFTHYAWFNPRPPSGSGASANIEAASPPTSEDGPVSVSLGDVYQEGTTSFAPYGLGTLEPLPAGYAALNGGYDITTTAIVSGPHVVNYSAASVTNQSVFNDLRIFHAEPDAFDPDKLIWVDRTILAPGRAGARFLSENSECQNR
jgi:hypothetical protein